MPRGSTGPIMWRPVRGFVFVLRGCRGRCCSRSAPCGELTWFRSFTGGRIFSMYVRGSGMRLRAELLGSLIACVAFAAEPPLHFAVIGREAGAWPQILSSVGFVRQDSDLAKVFVLRTATPASQ